MAKTPSRPSLKSSSAAKKRDVACLLLLGALDPLLGLSSEGLSPFKLPGAPKTMKNKGFHLHKTWFLGPKTRFLMVWGAPGTWFCFSAVFLNDFGPTKAPLRRFFFRAGRQLLDHAQHGACKFQRKKLFLPGAPALLTIKNLVCCYLKKKKNRFFGGAKLCFSWF